MLCVHCGSPLACATLLTMHACVASAHVHACGLLRNTCDRHASVQSRCRSGQKLRGRTSSICWARRRYMTVRSRLAVHVSSQCWHNLLNVPAKTRRNSCLIQQSNVSQDHANIPTLHSSHRGCIHTCTSWSAARAPLD